MKKVSVLVAWLKKNYSNIILFIVSALAGIGLANVMLLIEKILKACGRY